MTWTCRVILKHLLLICCAFHLQSCATSQLPITYGKQPNHLTYVPARTAVLPCQRWPKKASYTGLSLSNADEASFVAFCKDIDRFVLDGFVDQPYMRGFSPKAVTKFLTEAKQSDLLSQADERWKHEDSDCATCTNPAAYYTQTIATRATWRQWLKQLSQHARNADAVLMPMVTQAFEDSVNDRGLLIARRVVGVTMLLIDTDSGSLIWAGGRIAQATNQELVGARSASTLKAPAWDQAMKRLLVDDIWRDFPGRLIN